MKNFHLFLSLLLLILLVLLASSKPIELKLSLPPTDSVYSEYQVDTPPKPLNMLKVFDDFNLGEYYFLIQRMNFMILVDEEGRYERDSFLNKVHPLVEEEARRHFPELQFVPAKKEGRAVKCWTSCSVCIHLER